MRLEKHTVIFESGYKRVVMKEITCKDLIHPFHICQTLCFMGEEKKTLEELHNCACLPTPPFSHKLSLNYRCGCWGQHCFEEMQHTCSFVIWKFANSLVHRGFLHFLEVGGRDVLTSTWPGSLLQTQVALQPNKSMSNAPCLKRV